MVVVVLLVVSMSLALHCCVGLKMCVCGKYRINNYEWSGDPEYFYIFLRVFVDLPALEVTVRPARLERCRFWLLEFPSVQRQFIQQFAQIFLNLLDHILGFHRRIIREVCRHERGKGGGRDEMSKPSLASCDHAPLL